MFLVVNVGSSSVKIAVYDNKSSKIASILVDNVTVQPVLKVTGADDLPQVNKVGHDAVFSQILPWIFKKWGINAVGHRVVHGGSDYSVPIIINNDALHNLKKLIPLAPLHQPYNLQPIEYIIKNYPNMPQVACFDTAFHRTSNDMARQFAIPKSYYDAGVQRYGFHGLSYQYIATQLPTITNASRVIVAHLGNGASLCGMLNGRSYDTTMGFSALDGLVMGTRFGRLDAGVVLYLLQNNTTEEVQNILYKKSGLLGVSGISHDMRELLASQSAAAVNAVKLYVYNIIKEIGGLSAVLGGCDAIVFTAGIGENSPEIRKMVCDGLISMGVAIDNSANISNDVIISDINSKIKLYRIPTNEEIVVVDAVLELVK